jgi:hypothetical protein
MSKNYPVYLRNYFIIILIIFSPVLAVSQHIVINEIMSSNISTISDEDGDYPDWIELYNHGEEPVDLSGWGLSDDLENPMRWIFPKVVMQPGDFLLVWVSGKDRRPESTEMTAGLMREVYSNIPGVNVSDLTNHPSYPGSPSSSEMVLQLFEAPTNIGDHYGQRMHGWIKAPVSGEYSFWIASDDEGRLYLSTNENPANSALIAQVPGWTNPREWAKFSQQQSIKIYLEEGKLYYIKALMKEGVGGDNLAVGWQLPDGTLERPISGANLFWKDAAMLHTNFSISSAGEDILITNSNGELIDHLAPQAIPANISWGRFPDGLGEMMYFSNSTPGESNHSEGYTELLSPPIFSHTAGFYADPFSLIMSHTDPEVTIIYTLDGSDPDPDNIDGTTFQYKNVYPGTLLNSSYKSYSYDGPIYITDRTDSLERMASFGTDLDGFRIKPQDERIYKGNVVRAMAVKEMGLPSPIVTRSYFVSPDAPDRYNLPVVSITIPPNHLFDYTTGIYTPGKIWDTHGGNRRDGGAPTNYWQRDDEWERPAHLEFFDGVSNLAISQGIGLRMHGGWSNLYPMKSMRLYARRKYGESRFNHQIFPDQPYDSYNRLLLRISGNDFGSTMFRDAAIQEMVKHLDPDVQAYRPVIHLINGEFWGIINIRERYDKHYLNRVYGVDPDNIDMLKYNLRVLVEEGDMEHYNAMIHYIDGQNLSNNNLFQHVHTLMDVENFTDYTISNIYVFNQDWPGNNVRLWRTKTPFTPDAPSGQDGRWRWLLFDTDYGLGWWNEKGVPERITTPTAVEHNTLTYATKSSGDPGGGAWPNPYFSTVIFRNLLDNTEYRNYFINRFADLLNTTFLPGRTTPIISQMKANIEPAMEEHIARWRMPGSMSEWDGQVQIMVDFLEERPAFQRQHIVDHFKLSGQLQVKVDVSSPAHGYVRINTIDLLPTTQGVSENPYPWTGTYFRGIPVTFEAIPKPGYVFAGWEGLNNTLDRTTQQVFSGASANVIARFTTANLLHYWHFNNLGSDELSVIDTDQTLIGGAKISYPGSGEGYIDRVSDGSSLNAIDGKQVGYGLRVRNPSHSRELLIDAPTTGYKNITLSYATKRTPNGARWQQVQYRVNEQEEWKDLSSSSEITEDWNVFLFSLPSVGGDDNAGLKIRILFQGDEAQGNSGNNRFDNLRIEGIPVDHDVSSINFKETEVRDFRVWYSEGVFHVVNPFPEKCTLYLYNLNGVVLNSFTINGDGHHIIPFAPNSGLYIARIIGVNGAISLKFLVM